MNSTCWTIHNHESLNCVLFVKICALIRVQ